MLPGHVSVVLGEEAFCYLPDEYGMRGVISGFEPAQLLSGIYQLLKLDYEEKVAIINDYPAVVSKKGNQTAQFFMSN